jgi:hypothetical protein
MRPRLPAILSAPGGLGHRFALDCSRRFFGLRTLLAVSSVASGRIKFVSRPTIGPLFYGLSIHFQLLSTPCRHDAVTFSYRREAPPERDFHPPMHVHFQAHIGVGTRDSTSPLPPNRTGGFPASGSPVSGLISEIGSLFPGLRLRRLARGRRSRLRASVDDREWPRGSIRCACAAGGVAIAAASIRPGV